MDAAADDLGAVHGQVVAVPGPLASGALFRVEGVADGRAFDVAAMFDVDVTPWWFIGGGYRTVEGGADVDSVYNFAWLNAAVVRTGITF